MNSDQTIAPDTQRTCPECNLLFDAPIPESGLLTCPLCETEFLVGAPSSPPVPAPVVQPAAPRTQAVATSGKHLVAGIATLAGVLFVAGGAGYAYRWFQEDSPPRPATPSPSQVTVNLVQPDAVPEDKSEPNKSEPPAPEDNPPPAVERPVLIRRTPAYSPPPRPPVAVVKPLPERINRAIDRGVEYLQTHYRHPRQYENYLGLLGLTLLECGVPPNDPTIQEIAKLIRSRQHDLDRTYELALAILFLDRLGFSLDRPVIFNLGQRLMMGQLECGAWTYNAHAAAVIRRFVAPPRPAPLPPVDLPSVVGPPVHNPRMNKAPPNPLKHFTGDNSNTQFALLGVWVAQRYGVNTGLALAKAAQFFRNHQESDGSWTYTTHAKARKDSMTCAGLLSLAMAHGQSRARGSNIRPDQPVQVRDPAIARGLRFLGGALDRVHETGGMIAGADSWGQLYFLYSLERVAVIYDLQTIGDKEWYPWAATMLVNVQQADGSWAEQHIAPVGTCFALLILKRSNVARDLQLAIKQLGPNRDPNPANGPTILKGPGAGLGGTTVAPKPPLQGTTTSREPPESPGPTMIQKPSLEKAPRGVTQTPSTNE
jgi:hypothetical protein